MRAPTEPIEQPPVGGFCEECGHFAARHDMGDCTGISHPCDCAGMLWNGRRWPRPWLAAPDGLVSA